MTLQQLYQIIQDRKKNMPKDSYVVSLLKNGKDRILQKIGEEATEVIIAAKNENRDQIIFETADVLFHIFVLLAALEIKPKDIFEELEKRKK